MILELISLACEDVLFEQAFPLLLGIGYVLHTDLKLARNGERPALRDNPGAVVDTVDGYRMLRPEPKMAVGLDGLPPLPNLVGDRQDVYPCLLQLWNLLIPTDWIERPHRRLRRIGMLGLSAKVERREVGGD